ncbi:MAG: putative porin [Desulfobacula sp.]|nr:putative porin [Desulfobacula sp.]
MKLLLCISVFLGVFCLWSPVFAEEKPPENFDTTAELIRLLREKGIISESEAGNFLERYQQQAQATPQVVTITPAQGQEEYLQEISKDVTDKVTRDLNDMKQGVDRRADDLAKTNRQLKEKLDQLEAVVKKDHGKKLEKSSWAQRIRFGGDIRLRQESVLFDKGNARDIEDPSSPNTLMNTTNDEHRQRIRLRVGMKADLIEPGDINVGKTEAGVRVATGSVGNPVSTNHTLGHASNDRADIVLDQAYLKWSYTPTEGILGKKPRISVTGGIMENPFYSSSLVFDSDLAFEGAAVNLVTDTNGFSNGFLTLGYFPLEESEWSQQDKYLVGGQVGINHHPTYGWEYRIGAALYEYTKVTGNPIDNDDGSLSTADEHALSAMAPKFMQKGNTIFNMDRQATSFPNDRDEIYGLLSEFQLLNLTGRIENTMFAPVHIVLYGDWVKNLGYDPEKMSEKTLGDYSNAEIQSISGDTGYLVGLKVGYPKPRHRWDWNLFAEYRYLESDAVLDAFTDSDFHLGGTNAKGFIFGGELGLYDNVWLGARWMSANEITDMQSIDNTQENDLAVDTIQIDINAEF